MPRRRPALGRYANQPLPFSLPSFQLPQGDPVPSRPAAPVAAAAAAAQEKVCAACLTPASEQCRLRKCSRCGVVYYCSVDCQRADWQLHRPACEATASGENSTRPAAAAAPASARQQQRQPAKPDEPSCWTSDSDDAPEDDVDESVVLAEMTARVARNSGRIVDEALDARLIKAERARLREIRASAAVQEALRSDVQFECYLLNITPRVTRTLVVPGDTSLAQLNLILKAAMGWVVEEYHTYIFRRFGMRISRSQIGLAYGDRDSVAMDGMHVGVHGITRFPAAEVMVADLLTAPGDRLQYCYDLGDLFCHKLVVQAVTRPKAGLNSIQRVRLLSGARSCPPEDGHGNWVYAQTLDILANPRHPKYRETMHTAAHAANMHHHFDPNEFSLVAAQRRLQAAINPVAAAARQQSGRPAGFHCTCALCNRQTEPPAPNPLAAMFAANGVDVPLMLSTRGGEYDPVARQAGNLQRGRGRSDSAAADAKRQCAFCLDLECINNPSWKFKRCSGCNQVWYCSVACQRLHWRAGHKDSCASAP